MLGDYIDQGPDSYLTVRKLLNNIGRGPVAVARLTLVADPTLILLQHLQTFTRRIIFHNYYFMVIKPIN